MPASACSRWAARLLSGWTAPEGHDCGAPQYPGGDRHRGATRPRRADPLSLRHHGAATRRPSAGNTPRWHPGPDAAPGWGPTDLSDAPISGTGRGHGGAGAGRSHLRTRVGRPDLLALRAGALLP